MDRLISLNAVIDVLKSTFSRTTAIEDIKAIPTAEPKIVPIANIHFDEDKMREVCKEVAENIVVEYDFKGKTNGEVIKILFPNIDNYFSNVIDLRLWWNSPYSPQERKER